MTKAKKLKVASYRQFVELGSEGEIRKFERRQQLLIDRRTLKREQARLRAALELWDRIRSSGDDAHSSHIRATLKASGHTVSRTNLANLKAELAREVSRRIETVVLVAPDLGSIKVSHSPTGTAHGAMWLSLAKAIVGESDFGDRYCLECNAAFPAERSTAKFCSGACKVRAFRREA